MHRSKTLICPHKEKNPHTYSNTQVQTENTHTHKLVAISRFTGHTERERKHNGRAKAFTTGIKAISVSLIKIYDIIMK